MLRNRPPLQNLWVTNGSDVDKKIKRLATSYSRDDNVLADRAALNNELSEKLKAQNELIKQKKIFPPFRIEYEGDFNHHPYSCEYKMQICDTKTSNVIANLGPRINNAEFDWLFDHPYVFRHTHMLSED